MVFGWAELVCGAPGWDGYRHIGRGECAETCGTPMFLARLPCGKMLAGLRALKASLAPDIEGEPGRLRSGRLGVVPDLEWMVGVRLPRGSTMCFSERVMVILAPDR